MRCQRWVGLAALCAGLALGVCGCNNARMVRWDGGNGVVAIPHNDNEWPSHNRDHAEELMRQKCPQGYTVLEEQEVTVGQVQHTNINSRQSGNPTLAALHLDSVKTNTSETTTTEDKKEWRITFRAAGAPAGAQSAVIQTAAYAPPATPQVAPGLPAQPVPAQ